MMGALETFNRALFLEMNAGVATSTAVIAFTKFIATGLILYVPILLAYLWVRGDDRQRSAALKAFITLALGLTINFFIGQIWYHPRPLALQLGNTYFFHVLDASFPSDHTTGFASVGFALVSGGIRRWGWITLVLALLVGWTRIYLGVHFPFDIVGAFVISYLSDRVVSLVWAKIGKRLTGSLNKMYRTLLAPLIARGWLRE